MLEVPAGDGLENWPDDRIWAELEDRLTATGRPPIERGEFVERDILDHRVRVCRPMQDRRLFFAGDAAHLITPAGGKGMNMAIQDAVELAAGLCDRYGQRNDGRRLADYWETRLPRVWRHEEFSNLMLSLFNAGTTFDGESDRGTTSRTVYAERGSISLSATLGFRAGSPTRTWASTTEAQIWMP